MKDKHGLLARKFPKVEKKHVPSFSPSPYFSPLPTAGRHWQGRRGGRFLFVNTPKRIFQTGDKRDASYLLLKDKFTYRKSHLFAKF
jgi:hypothetical protein